MRLCHYRYVLMRNTWKARAEERPNFTTIFNQLSEMHSKYVAVQVMDADYNTSHLTPEEDPNLSTSGRSCVPEPLSTSGDASGSLNVPRASKGGKNEQDVLSITFSVLSEEAGSGGESGGEDEPPSALDLEMLPSLIPKDSVEPTHMKTSSFSSQQTGHESFLELPSSFFTPRLPTAESSNHSIKPGGSSSTLMDTSSYTGHPSRGVEDSASTLLLPNTSPSPDLVSKASTVGDEIMSMTSGAPMNGSHGNADSVSKTSTLDLESVSTTVSVPYPSSSPSQASGLHTILSGPNDQKSRERSPLIMDSGMRGSGRYLSTPIGGASKSTDSGIRSDEDVDAHILDTQTVSVEQDVEEEDNKQGSRHLSVTSHESVGLAGIGDLSSDLMSAFEQWKIN